ncbi:hypothetical protein VTH06DRAFT_1929 [Thermothelomyces fergusii]
MALYSEPPPLRRYSQDKPTLLVCWWITMFCAVIITLRVIGRFIRTEKLFREDKIAALALVPLFLRMGVVHVVLTYGTNNARLQDAGLSDDQLRKRSIASGLVLLSRVFYAATLWVLKYAIVEFLGRLNVSWRRTYERSLQFIRGFLIVTLLAVVISDLAECRPFSHYWQVLPDPGGRCRQGYAQLLTMAVCNVTTDLMLVIFPVPVVLSSSMNVKRKLHLVLLFSLSLAPVVVTIYRVPRIFKHHGSQQARSLYASVELLFATAAANALVLGSFVRDRGVKKQRFKHSSVAAASVDRQAAYESRRPTVRQHWGSDEDLVRDLGLGVKPELRETRPSLDEGRPCVPAPPVHPHQPDLTAWRFPAAHDQPASPSSIFPSSTSPQRSDDRQPPHRHVSFCDCGGLLDDQNPPPPTTTTPRDESFFREPSRWFGSSSASGSASDPSPTRVPVPAVPASENGLRRGSAAPLRNLGGLRGTTSGQAPIGEPRSPPQQQRDGPPGWEQQPQLVDAGGLLALPGGKQP